MNNYKIENNTFYGLLNPPSKPLKEIILPEFVYDISGVWLDAFKYNILGEQANNIEHVIAPSVTVIGDFAFSRCYNMRYVDFPKARIIGHRAFASTRIEEFSTSSDERIIIKSSAFSLCEKLKSVSISSKKDIIISSYAFEGNTSLEKIVLSGDRIFIETNAFSQCPNLKEIIINNEKFISLYFDSFIGIQPKILKIENLDEGILHQLRYNSGMDFSYLEDKELKLALEVI